LKAQSYFNGKAH